MNCREFLDNYSAWVDGDADPEWSDRAAVHALTCESCGRYDEIFRRGRELLASSEEELEVDEVAFRTSLQTRLLQSRVDQAADRTLGSGAPLMSLLAMTVVVLSVAWVPVLIEVAGPTVDLSPIEARRPAVASNGVTIRLPTVEIRPTRTLRPTSSGSTSGFAGFRPATLERGTRTLAGPGVSDDGFWSRPDILLRQYAPVLEPYRAGTRPGID